MSEIVSAEAIAGRIYSIRGQKVMLDRDLAALYRVATRVLNQAVSRNLERFPCDFMFELSRDEITGISQFVISSNIKYSKRVRAFTEHGALMAASLLNSPHAIQTSLFVVRAFVRLREMLVTHVELKRKIEELEAQYDEKFRIVFAALRQLLEPGDSPPRKIGFTAREKRQPYCDSAAAPSPALTPAARKRWDRLTPKLQTMLLGNVWCGACRQAGGMQLLSGKIEKGQLVLHGTCAACGEPVARMVERD
jgi:hypothetical protein